MTHREITLLAFVDSALTEPQVQTLQRFVADELSAAREWALAPPRFVDETVDRIRTVGVTLALRSSFDAEGRLIDEASDRDHYEDVRALVEGLQRFSAEHSLDLGVELDGDSAGWIESGRLSPSLATGLLDAWAARFAG
jgi:hypothetical protein